MIKKCKYEKPFIITVFDVQLKWQNEIHGKIDIEKTKYANFVISGDQLSNSGLFINNFRF